MASRVNVVVDWEAGDTGVTCWTIFRGPDPKDRQQGFVNGFPMYHVTNENLRPVLLRQGLSLFARLGLNHSARLILINIYEAS